MAILSLFIGEICFIFNEYNEAVLGLIDYICYNICMGKMPISKQIAEEVVKLRQTGHSIPEIHRILKISKSTALRYCKGIDILPDYKNRWLERRNASKIISEKAWKIASKYSENFLVSINQKELKILGAALYWAEGAKRQFSFINSDPEMVRLFVYILQNVYNVPNESIKISLRIFEDIHKAAAIKFWSEITGMSLNDKTEINIIKGSKKGKLPYGMCRVVVRKGGLLLKTIFAINKRVSELISPRSSMD